jgi:hypothetical protein
LLYNSSLSLASWTCLARKSFDPLETFEDFKICYKKHGTKMKNQETKQSRKSK